VKETETTQEKKEDWLELAEADLGFHHLIVYSFRDRPYSDTSFINNSSINVPLICILISFCCG
jgi:hypothetical protein